MAYNILTVDDSDVIRAMIARTLRLTSLPIGEIFEASNGREALDVLDDEWVDLVLADINMPVMDGAEMLNQMRLKPETAGVPVIVVSTEGATERVKELTERGLAAWIRKPFTPEEIRDVIVDATSRFPDATAHLHHIDAVFCPLLETFAFACPETTERADAPDPGHDLFCASISFSGAANGTLTVAAPAELCTELAANILGIETDDPTARIKGADTLGEITNIASGHIATNIEPNIQTDLFPPVVVQMDREDWARMSNTEATRAYVIDGFPVLVRLGLRATTVAV
jgi:two-component system chemotaxis response regulator CheY